MTLTSKRHQHTTGLVLAGGEGRRAGGRDKGLIEWRGKPMVGHVLASLSPQVDEVIIQLQPQPRPLSTTVADPGNRSSGAVTPDHWRGSRPQRPM